MNFENSNNEKTHSNEDEDIIGNSNTLNYLQLVDILGKVEIENSPLDEIGYSSLNYSFNEFNESRAKVHNFASKLRAVIPTNNQIDLLTQSQNLNFTTNTNTTHNNDTGKLTDTMKSDLEKKKARRKKRFEKQCKTTQEMSQPKPLKLPPQDPPKVIKRRESIGGTPLYSKFPKGKIELFKRIENLEKAHRKIEEHKKLICSNSVKLIDKEGVEWGYNEKGKKLKKEQLGKEIIQEKKRLEDEEIKKKKENSIKMVSIQPVNLISKTQPYIENKQNLELMINEKVIHGKWTPNKFPATSITTNIYDDSIIPKDAIRIWPEYDKMEIGDVILTIEYCNGCDTHSESLNHDESKYLYFAEKVSRSLTNIAAEYSIRFSVALKPIQKYGKIVKSGFGPYSSQGHNQNKNFRVFGVDFSNRIGAFEIQVLYYKHVFIFNFTNSYIIL
jgi:hypothetical protein